MSTLSRVSTAAIKAETATVTSRRARNMVFRLTPCCRCMGRLSWREHRPQMNRKIQENPDRPENTTVTPVSTTVDTRNRASSPSMAQ